MKTFRKKIIYHFVSIVAVLMIFSCNSDDDHSEPREFIIKSEIRNSSYDCFISISNQNGDILFDTIGKDLRSTISFETTENDKIDLTYGYETDKFFKILTYRNIHSGFLLSTLVYDCSDEFSGTHFNSDKVELEIHGINQFRKLYFPFDYKEDIEIDESSNKIILRGSLQPNRDLIITVLGEEGGFKSFYLTDDEWVNIGDSILHKSINIDEFVTPQIHKIELGIDNQWMVESEIYTNDGRIISASKWSNHKDYQEGDDINLFTLPEIEINLIKLELSNGNVYSGYQYSSRIKEYPEEINFYRPTIELSTISSNSYEVNVNGGYNLSRIEYQYLENNNISSWSLFQKGDNQIKDNLPDIPGDFLNKSPLLSNKISDPRACIVKIYQMSDENALEDLYNMTGINRQLKCIEFSNRYAAKQF